MIAERRKQKLKSPRGNSKNKPKDMHDKRCALYVSNVGSSSKNLPSTLLISKISSEDIITCTGVKAKLEVNPDVAPLLPKLFSLNLKTSTR